MECELVMSARVLARMSVTRVYTPSGASSLLPGTNNMRSAGRLHFFFSPLPLPLPLPLKLLRHTCARARDAARRHVTRGATTTTTVTMTTIAISIAIVATGRNRSAARCSAVTRDGGGCGMAAAVGRGCSRRGACCCGDSIVHFSFSSSPAPALAKSSRPPLSPLQRLGKDGDEKARLLFSRRRKPPAKKNLKRGARTRVFLRRPGGAAARGGGFFFSLLPPIKAAPAR